VGYQGEWSRFLRVGANWQTRTRFGAFEKYRGLFAEKGRFDIPATWTLGLALRPAPSLTLALDVQKIDFSQVNSVGNPILPNLESAPLGADGGAGFG